MRKPETASYSEEITRYTKERADLTELKRKKLEESLIPIDAVEMVVGRLVIEIRQRITSSSLPDQEKADILADLQNIPVHEYLKAPSRITDSDAETSPESI